MGESARNKVDVAAVREHVVGSRRTRAHVIVCHDLQHKSRSLLDLFGFAMTAEPDVCAVMARALAEDILLDVALLKAELDGIEAFARRQIAKLTPP